MVSFQINRTVTKTEVDAWKWGISVTVLTMLLVAQYGLWTRNTVELFRWNLTGYESSSLKGSSTENDTNYGDTYEEVSEWKNVSNWPRDNSWDNLANNMDGICPCSKNLHAAKLSFGLMALTGEISRKPSLDSVMWLIIITPMLFYNEKKK